MGRDFWYAFVCWGLIFFAAATFGCGLINAAEKVGEFAEQNSATAKETVARIGELAGQVSEITEKVGQNYDQAIAALQGGLAEAKEKIAELDKDGDGKVSLEELLAALAGGLGLGGLLQKLGLRRTEKQANETIAGLQEQLEVQREKESRKRAELWAELKEMRSRVFEEVG